MPFRKVAISKGQYSDRPPKTCCGWQWNCNYL